MNYEYLKELPSFTKYCDERLKNNLPSISEIRSRHYLMQGLTGLDIPGGKNERLAELKHREFIDNIKTSSVRPYFTPYIYPRYDLEDVQDWRNKDESIERIIDLNTGRPTRYYHRGIDSLNFLDKNFYQNPDKKDLKLFMPRRGFAGSIVDRAMHW